MDNSKCIVLVPVASAIEFETQQALTVLMDRGYKVQTLRGGSQVDLVRSMMASKALAEGFEETMWIDADVVFDPDDVEKLRAHGLPMTAGLYVKKQRQEFACKFFAGTQPLTFGVGGGLVDVALLGMGFNHVRREVYDGIAKTCNLPPCGGCYDQEARVVPYFLPMIVEENGQPCYFSEDYSFCHRANLAGYKCVADTSIKLGHVKRHVKTWDDLPESKTYESMQIGFG